MTKTPLADGVAVTSANTTTDLTAAVGAGLVGYVFDLRVANDDTTNAVNYSCWILGADGTTQRPITGKCGGATSPLPVGATDLLVSEMPILVTAGEKIQVRADAANRLRAAYSMVTQ